ncbi:hypothetical protein PV325_000310 [Microctonus aethiopoides]|nr:hypothetical protein PV325_000310 [Microctonus aethiopoides]
MSKPDATLVEKAAAIGCSQPQDLIFFDQEGIIQDENNLRTRITTHDLGNTRTVTYQPHSMFTQLGFTRGDRAIQIAAPSGLYSRHLSTGLERPIGLTKLQKDLGIKTAPNNKFTPNLNSARGKTRAPTDIKDFSATLNADTSTKDNCVAEPSTSKPTDTTD